MFLTAGIVFDAEVFPLPLYVIVEFHCAYKVISPGEAKVVSPAA